MKAVRKLSVIVLSLILISISFINVFAADYTVNDINKRIESLLNYEYNYTNTNSLNGFVGNYLAPNAGTGESDWFIISLVKNGTKFNSDSYIKGLNKVISDIYKSGLKSTKITDLQRMGLAYTACNKDIQNISGQNLLADCTYNRELSELSAQGIMALDYALILLDSKNFYIPKNAITTRNQIIEKILSLQLDNGGFALTGTAPDADVTAMTVTALAPYIKNNKAVSKAINNALDRLSKMQKDDGNFASYGKLNCESTAQVVIMLTSLGIDPESDARFIKNGYSAFDAMLTYQTEKGGFTHLQNGNENQMAAYQALCALVAYKSFITSSQSLYNFSHESNYQQNVTEPKTNSSNNKNNSVSKVQKNNNSNNNNNSHNSNNSAFTYNESSDTPDNQNIDSSQNNSTNQNNTNIQTPKTKNNDSKTETFSTEKDTEPTENFSETAYSNNTSSSDEIIQNNFTNNINNFKEIKEYNNLYGAENLIGTGTVIFTLILGYIGLYIYFLTKFKPFYKNDSKKGE